MARDESPAVRAVRVAQVVALRIEERPTAGTDETGKVARPTDVWHSAEEADRRYPAPRGCTQVHTFETWTLGSYVRLTLDPDQPDTLFRFLRVVTSEDPDHLRKPRID